jgi:predicted lysophospholipase L1 biosynthesis ABC-type transport system permease subunit
MTPDTIPPETFHIIGACLYGLAAIVGALAIRAAFTLATVAGILVLFGTIFLHVGVAP